MSSLPRADPLRVAVLGAGPGGIQTFQGLAKAFASHPTPVDLVLVSERDYFFNNISTPRALADPTGTPVTRLMYPLAQLVKGDGKASGVTKRVLVGRVVSVDTDRQVTVVPSAGRNSLEWIQAASLGVVEGDGSFSADFLVVALGSQAAFPAKAPVGGISSAAMVEEFRGTTAKLADAKVKKVVVIGGGLVGIEMAGEIKSAYPTKDVTIVAPELLPGFPTALIAQASAALARQSITVIQRVRVADVPELTATSSFRPIFRPNFTVPLTPTDSRAPAPASITADAVFVATGVAPNSGPLDPRAWPITDRGYLRVTPDLAVEGVKGVFAVGDIIQYPGKPVGKLAMLAGLQSKVAAANVARTVRGELLKPWKPIPFMAVSMIGRDAGIGYMPGIGTKFGIGAAVAKMLKGKDGGIGLVNYLKETLPALDRA
ncbi:hypothetical protein AMAG_03837 [Allomyces macrogynus ATCC 38327]|uniref:FAD/NAD(P)-binding domain-containing protein n=1 Tax=Allomyces macrogynus (strain ATCC 38327) TaxID=578462 RepID=A0A0L0SAI2_ALLM3|nr:hypothetical protein AMAG_03837 [Allomyces macrogynus ATCC 38327]|eukprot:KNE59578.1 hypothetical protein AMAG_03837 [Allomyces macrogynus ATCC 38327]